MSPIKKIFITGFRATGKTTFAKSLSKRLNWRLIDIDEKIVKRSGKSIYELTHGRSEWVEFRKWEQKILKETINEENVVISSGGGLATNDVVIPGSGKTFGEINFELIKNLNDAFVILLTAPEEAIAERIRKRDLLGAQSRPLLGFKNADKIQELMMSPGVNKKEIIKLLIEDSLEVYKSRKPLYEKLADLEIDTSKFDIKDLSKNICISIGDPISGSLSPAMHNAAYKALGLDNKFAYLAIRVSAESLKKAVAAFKLLNIKFISVTMPHKTSIMDYLDQLDETAGKIGAVNSVLNKNGILKGFNTDWIGAVTALKHKTEISGKKVALLGAGGAAKAIAYGVTKEGGKLIIFNRTLEKAKSLAEQFNAEFSSNYDDLKDMDIIINSTSVGMNDPDVSPVSKGLIHKGQVVFDIVYKQHETKLLQDAKEKGAKIVYGIDMLLFQGVAQFELYTGVDAPIEEMRRALENEVGNGE